MLTSEQEVRAGCSEKLKVVMRLEAAAIERMDTSALMKRYQELRDREWELRKQLAGTQAGMI